LHSNRLLLKQNIPIAISHKIKIEAEIIEISSEKLSEKPNLIESGAVLKIKSKNPGTSRAFIRVISGSQSLNWSSSK